MILSGGVPLIVLILAVGIFLTIRLRGLQFTKLPRAVRHIIANEKEDKDGEESLRGLRKDRVSCWILCPFFCYNREKGGRR